MDTPKLLEEVKKEIARLQKVADLLEGGSTSTSGRRTRKPMSKARREKIAAAQRKRWAKVKAEAKS
jgi:hypothetical protein